MIRPKFESVRLLTGSPNCGVFSAFCASTLSSMVDVPCFCSRLSSRSRRLTLDPRTSG